MIDVGTEGWISMNHTFKVACNRGVKRKQTANGKNCMTHCFVC